MAYVILCKRFWSQRHATHCTLQYIYSINILQKRDCVSFKTIEIGRIGKNKIAFMCYYNIYKVNSNIMMFW